ncbi:GNAT family N-acetyltransferase [uncultured Cohaesibacter sp.]|uniref:GNAT family N-acetyltransferase n=1 Tax=uncultured Cohaesibacter sp. TaxID=1002546 RepID=UPI00292FC240|nr:GNAT family N-acetyltransferase [uncultured Cohaesibacter sp.]
MSEFDIKKLELDAALELAPLISAYAQERKRGAPRQPDMFYAEILLTDRTAEVMGAYVGGKLSAFCTFFDLPETISGKRVGHVDILYVDYEARGIGVTKAMIEALIQIGDERNWLELQWNDPNEVQQEKIAEISRLSTTESTRLSIGIHEEHTKVK